MTVVRGLDAITAADRPTKKQLDWIRSELGEEALDRVLMLNYSRAEVTQAIGEYIERNKKKHRPYRHWNVGFDWEDDCIPSLENSWGDDWG